jgi:sulfur-oxidizing protein SoxZ
MPEAIRMRIKLTGDVADVRVLIGHPMETGLRKDPKTGEFVPMHFIKTVTATLNGKPVLEAQWSRAVARNPYLQFRVKGVKANDEIGIAWIDNRGETNSTKAAVPPPA